MDSSYSYSSKIIAVGADRQNDTSNALFANVLPSKPTYQHRQRSASVCTMLDRRQYSFHSSHSSRSLVSNASSTKTHRRSVIEVGSMIFNSPGREVSSSHIQKRIIHYDVNANSNDNKEVICDYRSDIFPASPENRGPPSQATSASSLCHRVRVASSSDNSFSTNIMKTSKKHREDTPKTEVDESDSFRAMEMIRKLSFDTGSVPEQTRAPSSVCSAPPALLASNPDVNGDKTEDEEVQPANASDRSASPPLPPRIQRIGSPANSFISLQNMQVFHNRHRARSASLSEMSDSCLHEFCLQKDNADDDNEDESSLEDSCLSGVSSDSIGEYAPVRLNTIENVVSTSIQASPQAQHLTAMQSQAPMIWNRGRTSTLTSDQSSYVSPASTSSSSSLSSYVDSSSISTHEEELNDANDPPGYYEVDCTGFGDSHLYGLGAGYLSMQDDMHCDFNDIAVEDQFQDEDVLRPRLNSETLRRWNVICNVEENEHGLTTSKHHHIIRALSCPDVQTLAVDTTVDHFQPNDEIEISPDKPPHMMATATPTSAQSRSIFSYTNSGSPSTISSDMSDVDEIQSDLDFDIAVIYSTEASIEKDVGVIISEGADIINGTVHLKKTHRRSASGNSGFGKRRHTSKAGGNRHHRRHKSDGNVFNFSCFASEKRKKESRVFSLDEFPLSSIVEDAKSACSLAEELQPSHDNLVNILSRSFQSDDFNVAALGKEILGSVIERQKEKICWFAIGCCFGLLLPYLTK